MRDQPGIDFQDNGTMDELRKVSLKLDYELFTIQYEIYTYDSACGNITMDIMFS